MDKPNGIESEEEEEEEDHWKDASPITPTCSPTKHPPKTIETRTKTVEVEVHDFQPTSPLEGKDVIIIDSSAIPPSKKMAMKRESTATGVEKVAPKVKLKKEQVVEEDDPRSRKGIVVGPSTHVEKHGEKKRVSTMREAPTSDSLPDRGAKKKALNRNKEQDRRSSRRKIEEVDESLVTDIVSRGGELDEGSRKKRGNTEEVTIIRSREERKSLREQECIERVTEFLTKHSVLTYPELALTGEQEEKEEAKPSGSDAIEQRVVARSNLVEIQETPIRAATESTSREEPPLTRTRSVRRIEEGSAKTLPSPSTETEKPVSTRTVGKEVAVTPGKPPETREEVVKTSFPIQRASCLAETDVPATKRRSSMRKRPGTFSRESSRESLLDETKKEVRIQENVEEFFFEDNSEQMTGIVPEVQLVKARIITAEEAAANRIEEAMRIEVHSPPEVAVVNTDSVKVKSGRVPSPETVDMSQLQLISLAKSTSENTLIDTVGDTEENKVSERNIKAEILLDLSKAMDVGDEGEESVDGEKKDRRLSRTGSEGSKRSGLKGQGRLRERDGFKIGSLAQPDEPELTILLENERRRNVDDDRDSLVDFGVEKVIKR